MAEEHDNAARLIGQVATMREKYLDRRLMDLGTTTSQARVIVMIDDLQPVKPSVLATLLFQETQSITGILNRLEGQDVVTRTADATDHRAVQLTTTAKGRELARLVRQTEREMIGEWFDGLPSRDLRELTLALKTIRSLGFVRPECDFKLRRAALNPEWRD